LSKASAQQQRQQHRVRVAGSKHSRGSGASLPPEKTIVVCSNTTLSGSKPSRSAATAEAGSSEFTSSSSNVPPPDSARVMTPPPELDRLLAKPPELLRRKNEPRPEEERPPARSGVLLENVTRGKLLPRNDAAGDASGLPAACADARSKARTAGWCSAQLSRVGSMLSSPPGLSARGNPGWLRSRQIAAPTSSAKPPSSRCGAASSPTQ